MIEYHKKYRTRDGREVRIYAVDGMGGYPVHGAIKVMSDGDWSLAAWRNDGRRYSFAESETDLIEVKPRIKRDVWLNVYSGPQQAISWQFLSRELADSAAAACKADRIACVKVTIDCEEGEGL